MQSKIFLKYEKMAKTLIVTKPFFTLDAGDMLELTKDGEMYEASYNEEIGNSIDSGADVYGSYSSSFKISPSYAKELMEQGYLKTEDDDNKTTFVNVFTEIDNLIGKYSGELKNIDNDYKNAPQCLKVEKTTVLNNMLTVLNHLKNLKK